MITTNKLSLFANMHIDILHFRDNSKLYFRLEAAFKNKQNNTFSFFKEHALPQIGICNSQTLSR